MAATHARFFANSYFADDSLVFPPSLAHSLAPQAKGVLVVCDLTRENTFEAVKAWKKEIDEWARLEGREAGIPVVLIANKVCGIILEALGSGWVAKVEKDGWRTLGGCVNALPF